MSFYFYLNYYILQGIFSEMVPFAQLPECLKCQVMMTMQSHPNSQARVLTAMIKWKCWTFCICAYWTYAYSLAHQFCSQVCNQQRWYICSPKDICKNVHNNVIHNRQKLWKTQMFTHKRKDKWTVACSPSEMLEQWKGMNYYDQQHWFPQPQCWMKGD